MKTSLGGGQWLPGGSHLSANARDAELRRPGKIDLRIEELVLHGFEASDRHKVAAAVESELHRLFSVQPLPGWWQTDTELELLDAGGFTIPVGAAGHQIGEGLARTLSGAFSASAITVSDDLQTNQ
jgi:hypothetical protein